MLYTKLTIQNPGIPEMNIGPKIKYILFQQNKINYFFYTTMYLFCLSLIVLIKIIYIEGRSCGFRATYGIQPDFTLYTTANPPTLHRILYTLQPAKSLDFIETAYNPPQKTLRFTPEVLAC